MSGAKVKRTEGRRNARIKTMQALYQIDVAGGDTGAIISQFLETQDMSRVDTEYFTTLFRGVCGEMDALDEALGAHLDRPLDDLDAVERAVLRLAAWEFKTQLDVPYKVVINESVELTKKFGAEKGHRFVNGVVDKLARDFRAMELNALGQK
ncbi:transcription antitermination factor NusB [Granulosicoccaceae sp. 1_MG-2023]|nr:transcription antitermination factor NusB [Granulosicoccaceae sp. 1_MG-2023]